MAGLRWRSHRHWIFVVLVGVWTTYFLSPPASPWVWSVVPVSVAGAAMLMNRPIAGNVVTLAASLMSAGFEVEYGRTEVLLPVIGALFMLGRSRAPISVGVAFLLAQIGTTLLRDGATIESIPTQFIVYATPWLFGHIAGRRADSALAAVHEAERLAAIDVARVAQSVAEVERQRVVNDSIDTLGTALTQIQQRTTFALQAPRDDRIRAIQDAAKAAIQRLHVTLSALQSVPPAVAHKRSSGPAKPPLTPRRRLIFGALLAVVGTLVMLLFSAPLDSDWYRPVSLVPALILPAAALLARQFPLPAALAAAAALVTAALDSPHPPEALTPCAFPVAALCWRIAQAESRQRTWAIALVTIASPVLGMNHGREGVGFSLLVVFLGVVGGLAWSDRDAVLQREEARAAKLTAQLAAVRIGAAREERVRVARELHDVVSHAIASVSLQAQLARVRLDDDPDESEAALGRVLVTTAHASHELAVIARLLQPSDAGLDVWRLVEGAADLGLRVSPHIYDSLRGDELAYRVVQESLTNASRYAQGSRVDVRVALENGRVHIMVRNEAPLLPTIDSVGTGSGLAGLRDRVDARGGAITWGPVGDCGGFEVNASWPVGRVPLDDPEGMRHGDGVRP
ncbi:sensor histidine kinase [Gulosibacter sp. ACHW.36C]|uniref:histidine kinase n=1 Tax=Gulosibacter sediminis TaxID=1729695 RepID=A0ABY4MYU1_9MICO|nr:histidine kinase [Gulosibacter sediminis]UQN15606.1 histidine kinase [Gulosibacter sediminis]